MERGRARGWVLLAVLAALAGCGKRHAVALDGGPLDGPPADVRPWVDLSRPPDGWRPPDWGLPHDLWPPTDQAQPPDAPKPDIGPAVSAWVEMVPSLSGVLNDVWGSSPADVWAVGSSGLLMHFNGTSWSKVGSGTQMDLRGIWGKSAQQIYAVGSKGDLSYDGVFWQPSPQILGLTDVWGGGAHLFAADSFIIRYRQMGATGPGYWGTIPLYQLTTKPLNAVWALSDGEVYAVGDNGTVVACKAPSCAQYSPASWTLLPTGTQNHLTAIFGFSGSAIFAVGLGGTILRYDGAKWSKEPVTTDTYFYGVWGSSPTDVYAVGHPIFKSDESIFHYDGVSWNKLSPPKVSFLNSVWGASAKDVFAVGKTRILRLKTP